MYALDGSRCFPFYGIEILVYVFGFDHDKLTTDEVQALAILDTFQLMKTKDIIEMYEDIMEMFDEQEKLLAHLG